MRARAVAAGDHVHFAAGEYQPGSRAGQELLAHELVHVAQQKGATGLAGAGEQVAPSPALETEADALAPSVVQGAAVHPSAAPQVAVATKPKERNQAAEIEARADEREQVDQASQLTGSKAADLNTLTASTVSDADGAQDELQKIKQGDETLRTAIGTSAFAGMGEVDKHTLEDNRLAEAELGQFLAESGIQSTSLGNFQQQYQRLAMDLDRLDAMSTTLPISDPGGSGGKTAENLVNMEKLKEADRARMAADTDNPDAVASGPLAVKKAEVRQWKDKMIQASSGMQGAERAMAQKAYEYQAQVDNIAAGLTPRDAPEAQKKLESLQARLEKIKGYAKMCTGFATKALGGYIGTAAGTLVEQTAEESGIGVAEKHAKDLGDKVKDKVSDSVPDLANDFVGYLATLPWQSDLALAEADAQAALAEQQFHEKQQQINTLTALKLDMQNAVSNYLNIASSLEHAKAMVRRTMMETGRVADRSGHGHEHKWEALAAFYAESETYLAQSRATIDVGHNEMAQADRVGGERSKLATGGEGGVRWWSAREQKRVATDSYKWVLDEHPVRFFDRSVTDDQGRDEGIATDIARLEANGKWVQAFRDRLAKEFSGLRE